METKVSFLLIITLEVSLIEKLVYILLNVLLEDAEPLPFEQGEDPFEDYGGEDYGQEFEEESK